MDANSSYMWQSLSLRDKMRPHMFKHIGDGQSTFMWHDKWWEKGPY